MKFIQFFQSILPQVIKMKRLFTLSLHVTLWTDPAWLMKGPCHCLLPQIRISKINYVFTQSFNIQFMYENLNFSFLLWKKLYLYFVTFVLRASIEMG